MSERVQLKDLKVLVVGWNHYWAQGNTLEEALKKANRPRFYVAYIVHPDTTVNGFGYISYPQEYEPKEIARKRAKGKKVAA